MSTARLELVVSTESFEAIHTGLKTFEVTLLDENTKVGDYVVFKEFSGDNTPKRSTLKKITYIQHLTSTLYVIALNTPDESY